VGGAESEIHVKVLDSSRNPAPDVEVRFTATLGRIPESAVTDSLGIARVMLVSGSSAGSSVVTAGVGPLKMSIEVQFVRISSFISVLPKSIPADGMSSCEVAVTVRDSSGRPMAGVGVGFSATSGTIEPSARTDESGIAKVKLTGIASRTDVVSTITASLEGMREQLTAEVVFRGLTLTVSSDADSLPADGMSGSTITASLRETSTGKAIPGVEVSFSTDIGFINPSAITDRLGNAKATLKSGYETGEATVKASYGEGISSELKVFFTPHGITLSLVADPVRIAADGMSTATVSARLRNGNNNPIVGAEISFSTSLGTITSSGITDESGLATATLTSERCNGTALVRASFGPISETLPVEFSGVTVELDASPKGVIADGASASGITLLLTDGAGRPIAGEEVTLSTSLGELLPPSGRTDGYGRFEASLRSGEAGRAIVTAHAAGASGEVAVDFTRFSFSLEAEEYDITVNGSSTTITATLMDNLGNPVPGIEIDFSSTLGSIDEGGVTDDTGRTSVTLVSGGVVGQALVTASARLPDGTVGSSITVNFSAAPPERIVLSADPSVVAVGGGSSRITAVVTDGRGNPVPDVTVSFAVISGPGGGEHLDRGTASTDGSGRASVNFISGLLASEFGGVAISAATSGISSEPLLLTIAGAPHRITVGYSQPSSNGDGTYTLPISAIVSDANGNSVVDGTTVYFSVSPAIGVVKSPVATKDGRATTSFVYPAAELGSHITVIARSGDISGSTGLILPGAEGEVSGITLSISPGSPEDILADGQSTTLIEAYVTDRDGTGMPNILVTFDVDFGSITRSAFTESPTLSEPYKGGRAVATLTSAPSPSDTVATIVASAGGITSAPLRVRLRGISLSLSVYPESIPADGRSCVSVTAVVKETTSGVPVPGKTVLFGTDLGTIDGSAITDSRGVATATFTSGRTPGRATVRASCGGGLESLAYVDISPAAPGPASRFTLSVEKVNIAGLVRFGLEDVVTAYVYDGSGNPVPEGTSVYFTSDGGGIASSSLTDEYGRASVKLIAAGPCPEDGIVTVTARTMGSEGPLTASVSVVFSGRTQIDAPSSFNIPDGGRVDLSFSVSDENGNPLVGGTKVSVSTSAGLSVQGVSSFEIPDTMDKKWTHFTVRIADADPGDGDPPKDCWVTIEVTTPADGNGSSETVVYGSVD